MSHLQDILGLYGFNEVESQGLLETLRIVNCTVNLDKADSTEKELAALNEALQSCFLRPIGTERQQFNDIFKDEELRSQLLPHLSPFINSINTGNALPIKMLLGANENSTKERFNILVNLEENGHHADIVYLLGGKRDLWIDYEPITIGLLIERLIKNNNITEEDAKLEVTNAIDEFFPDKNNIGIKRLAIVKHFTDNGIIWPTEADMMVRLAKSYKELSSTKFILVNAPNKLNDKGQVVRPDTLDTYNQLWEDYGKNITLSAKTQPNRKLPMAIVTTQPYGHYQYSQAISAFHDKPVNILVVASGINNINDVNLAIVFDSFARTIYAGKNIVLKKIIAPAHFKSTEL